MLSIIAPETDEEIAAVRQLCWAYRAFLLSLGGSDERVVRLFYPEETYAALMENLTQLHAPPGGGLRLALRDDQPVGCGMWHTLAPGDAELKRVFIAPEARGTGAGHKMVEALIAACREAGFRRILLDTGKVLKPACALYRAQGFIERGPYQKVPAVALPNLTFFELPLEDAEAARNTSG